MSSDDNDNTDISDEYTEHDDDEFDDDDRGKKPSASKRGDEVIGGVAFDCEGDCGQRVDPNWIATIHCGACTCWGQGGRFNHRPPVDDRRELRSLLP